MACISDYGRPVQRLFEKACEAARWAYAPNSRVRVGAAAFVEGYPGIRPRTVVGFNAEIRVHNEAIHCEESLTDAALRLYEPSHRPVRFFRDCMVLVASIPSPLPPCGACRDLLVQHARPDTKVIMANQDGYATDSTVAGLLPDARSLLDEQRATEVNLREFLYEMEGEKGEGYGSDVEQWVEEAWDLLSRQQVMGKDPKAYAVLASYGHTDFRGGTVSQLAFHGFQALELAAARAFDASIQKDHEVFPIDRAVYVADKKGFALPSGRERQWLYDLGRNGDKPVSVLCISRTKALLTNSEDLLPGSCTDNLEEQISGR